MARPSSAKHPHLSLYVIKAASTSYCTTTQTHTELGSLQDGHLRKSETMHACFLFALVGFACACLVFEVNLELERATVAITIASSELVDIGPTIMDPYNVFDHQLLQRMSDRMIRDAIQASEHELRDHQWAMAQESHRHIVKGCAPSQAKPCGSRPTMNVEDGIRVMSIGGPTTTTRPQQTIALQFSLVKIAPRPRTTPTPATIQGER